MADLLPGGAPDAPGPQAGTSGVVVSGPVKKLRRRYTLLTRRDKLTLGLMVGIPLIFDLIMIWGPTLVSVGFSFTNWNGIGAITEKNIIGTKNYESLFTAYPFFWPALQHNLIWLA